MTKKEHWEKIFGSKPITGVSWYQPAPAESLEMIRSFDLPRSAAVMDAGGGDSFLADHLLDLGFTNITVLDISKTAIERAKQRLGDRAKLVNWVVSDVLEFKTNMKFDCWHDRASFHFLTTGEEISTYVNIVRSHIKPGGKLVIGTFSTNGPEKCSNLPVRQYSEGTLTQTLQQWFKKVKCMTVDHLTPFKTIQHFIFCSFQHINR